MVLGFWDVRSQEVIDVLQRVHEAAGPAGPAVVAVNYVNTPEQARHELARRQVDFPVIVDDSYAAKEVFVGGYGVYQWPAFFLIDAEGTIVDTWRDQVDQVLPRLRKAGLIEGGFQDPTSGDGSDR